VYLNEDNSVSQSDFSEEINDDDELKKDDK
jgi:hypothetical protein